MITTLYPNSFLITFLLVSCVPSSSKNQPIDLGNEDTAHQNLSSTNDFEDTSYPNEPEDVECDGMLGQEMDFTITEHFSNWLTRHNYDASKVARTDIVGGSFGGMISNSDCVHKEPIIFIHGNSDQAILGTFGGWEKSREYFLSQGYRSSELYATTYGLPPLQPSSTYTHDQENILQIRQFIEAVLQYTEADKIDIIAHSLGVTMTRRAILGGSEHNIDGSEYQIGAPLTNKIDTFLGIAGANQGLSSCALVDPAAPVCHKELGLYPGWWDGMSVVDRSTILDTLNDEERYEGSFIYSMWTANDAILGPNCLVWGVNSCKIPEQDGEYSVLWLDHLGLKTDTVASQYSMVVEHIIP